MKQELFTPLRTYQEIEKQNRFRFFYEDRAIRYHLAAPKNSFLSICFLREPSSNLISSIQVLRVSDDSVEYSETDIPTIEGYFNIYQLRDSDEVVTDDIIFYNGGDIAGMTLSEGNYYIKIIDEGTNTWYTETFCVVSDTCNFIRMRWWNSRDIKFFPYSQGFVHTLYLDSHLIEDETLLKEEGAENGQLDFLPTFTKIMKQYHMKTDVIPPYLKDAISITQMHDNVFLSQPDLPIHIDGTTLLDIELEGEWVTKMSWDGQFKFRIDATLKSASQEDLNINSLITQETIHALSGIYANEFDACNDVGTIAPVNRFSEDAVLIIGSLIYTTAGNNTNTLPTGWYLDAVNNKSVHVDSGGLIDQFFTCITEFEHNLVLGLASEALACATVLPSAIVYSDDAVLIASSLLYSVSQDVSSTVANGWILDRDTDKPIEVTGGAGIINSVGTQCSETLHILLAGPFGDESTACGAVVTSTNFYSRDTVLVISSILYTISHNNISFASAGWYKDVPNDDAIEVDSSGVLLSINLCTEFDYELVGPEASEVGICNSVAGTNTFYSSSSSLSVNDFLYTIAGNPTSFVSDGFYKDLLDNNYETVGGEIVAISLCF